MAKTVSASQANQNFSRLLAEAEEGQVITILRRGRPTARLVPAVEDERERRIAAVDDYVAFVRSLDPVVTGPWTRDELYD